MMSEEVRSTDCRFDSDLGGHRFPCGGDSPLVHLTLAS